MPGSATTSATATSVVASSPMRRPPRPPPPRCPLLAVPLRTPPLPVGLPGRPPAPRSSGGDGGLPQKCLPAAAGADGGASGTNGITPPLSVLLIAAAVTPAARLAAAARSGDGVPDAFARRRLPSAVRTSRSHGLPAPLPCVAMAVTLIRGMPLDAAAPAVTAAHAQGWRRRHLSSQKLSAAWRDGRRTHRGLNRPYHDAFTYVPCGPPGFGSFCRPREQPDCQMCRW